MNRGFELTAPRFMGIHDRNKGVFINFKHNGFQFSHFKPCHDRVNDFFGFIRISAFSLKLGGSPSKLGARLRLKFPHTDLPQ